MFNRRNFIQNLTSIPFIAFLFGLTKPQEDSETKTVHGSKTIFSKNGKVIRIECEYSICYYRDGKLYNENGPSIIYLSTNLKEYWRHGNLYFAVDHNGTINQYCLDNDAKKAGFDIDFVKRTMYNV